MARQRHLKNAPITEALIDCRVLTSHRLDAKAADVVAQRLHDSYSLKGPVRLGQINVGPEIKVETQELGYRFHSKDEKFVAQFQNQGFTLSRLAPYTDWEHLAGEAEKLWSLYVDLMQPERIEQIACRYINNLALPMGEGRDFKEFLVAAPEVPRTLPQSLMSFMQRVVLPYPERNTVLLLTQLLEPNAAATSDKVPVILDIDVQCRQQFDPRGRDVWQRLDRLRALKNEAFFESITETTAELYQ